MKAQDKNTGTGPSERHYGKAEQHIANREDDSHTKKGMDQGGTSGKADQQATAAKHSDEDGHDDLDNFDMDSLRGDIKSNQ